MTKEQLLALIDAKVQAEASGLMVKRTEKGGIFIRHASFKAFSERTGKEYTSGINLPATVAYALFNNDALIADIRKQLAVLAQ